MTKSLTAIPADLAATTFRYYDLKKNWRKVKRHLRDPAPNDILVEDFNKLTLGLWNEPFHEDQYPHDFEDRPWWPNRYNDPKLRFCNYRRYVKHGASYWLVNFTLRLAMLVEPNREWRIITSDQHSTVWDGRDTLFDFNWQALSVPPGECFCSAYDMELRPGEFMETAFAAPYSKQKKRKASTL
jgi:hypothetical protein